MPLLSRAVQSDRSPLQCFLDAHIKPKLEKPLATPADVCKVLNPVKSIHVQGRCIDAETYVTSAFNCMLVWSLRDRGMYLPHVHVPDGGLDAWLLRKAKACGSGLEARMVTAALSYEREGQVTHNKVDPLRARIRDACFIPNCETSDANEQRRVRQYIVETLTLPEYQDLLHNGVPWWGTVPVPAQWLLYQLAARVHDEAGQVDLVHTVPPSFCRSFWERHHEVSMPEGIRHAIQRRMMTEEVTAPMRKRRRSRDAPSGKRRRKEA